MSWMKGLRGWVEDKFADLEPELDDLSQDLRTGLPDKRLAAVRRLGRMKAPDSVSLLIGALKDEDPVVRGVGATELGAKRDKRGAAPLAVLLGDEESTVRAAAVEGLSSMGTPILPGRFRSLFWKPASNALEDDRVADYLASALSDDDLEVRLTSLRILPRHGVAGIGALRKYFEAGEHPELSQHLKLALPELGKALQADEAEHRKAAVEGLYALYGQEAIKPLLGALSDEAAKVRQAAVDAVTALGPRPALEQLLPRLRDDLAHLYDSLRAGVYEPVHGTAVIDAVKQAFDGSGDLVIRIHEAEGARSRVRLLLDRDGCVSEVDLLEDPIDEPTQQLPASTCSRVELTLRPFQILTLRVSQR